MGADVAAEEQFGPYLVYERLGVGGMATVHRALERGIEGFERIVALKRLLPHLAEDASFIKSFVREAKLASLLNHINIVQIFELGRVGAQYFISMEYIDGKDIRRILRHARRVTGPPPIHVTVGLLLQLCDALDYAHAKADDTGHPLGLVHRDVSPSNLLITTQGHLKVIDFGIAKAQSAQLRTQTGRVKGKLAYMAPEAIAGKDLDARSDLFAAGVIAHELLTARPLFASKNEYQTLMKVQRGDIMPPSTFNQACPPELDAIVLRALARDPDDRFATAGDVREELHAMRRQYNLQTGFREVAGWIDWAFTIEAPSGSFAATTLDHTGSDPRSSVRNKTPPAKRDEEEAVEIAWGGGEQASGGPVLLDDIPDVSEKHLAAPKNDDEEDDIPTPQPSHGRGPAAASLSAMLSADDEDRVARGTGPVPSIRSDARHNSALLRVPTVEGRSRTPTVPPLGSRRSSQSIPVQSDDSRPNQRERRTTAPGVGESSAPKARPPGLADSSAPKARPTPPAVTPGRATPLPEVPKLRPTPPPIPGSGPTKRPSAMAAVVEAAKTDPTGELLAIPAPASAERASTRMRVEREAAEATPASAEGASTRMRPASAEMRGEREAVERDALEASDTAPGIPAIETAPKLPAVARGSVPPQRLSPPLDSPALESRQKIPRTRPGMTGKPRPPADRTTPLPVDDFPPTRVSASFSIGATIAARKQSRRGAWVALVMLLLLGGAATAGIIYATRDDKSTDVNPTPRRAEPRTGASVKFVTEPADAEIRVEGNPLAAGVRTMELAAGSHQIEIHHTGFKAWLTSIDLAAGEIQTLRVVLEPLGGTPATSEATLKMSSSPPGLEVWIDGQLFALRTPFKTPIKVGAHVLTIKENGVEVWRQSVSASPNNNYEFSPTIGEQHKPPEPAPAPTKSTKARHTDNAPLHPTTETPAAPADATPTPALTTPQTTTPPVPVPVPPPPEPKPPAQITAPTTTPPATAKPTGPLLVAPTAVTRIGGQTPSISRTRYSDIPPIVAAKVCIDAGGHVMSADLITKMDHRAAVELIEAIRTWLYAPYKKNGTPWPVCFVVSFRVR